MGLIFLTLWIWWRPHNAMLCNVCILHWNVFKILPTLAHTKFYCCFFSFRFVSFCFFLFLCPKCYCSKILYSIRLNEFLNQKSEELSTCHDSIAVKANNNDTEFQSMCAEIQKLHNRQQFFRNQALIFSWSFSSLSALTSSTNKQTNKNDIIKYTRSTTTTTTTTTTSSSHSSSFSFGYSLKI